MGAAHRHEGADVGGFERRKTFQRYLRAPMLAEEFEALPDIAGIGFQRLRRQPPLGAQMRQPPRHLERDGLVGAGEFDRLGGGGGSGFGFGHGTIFGVIPSDYMALVSFTVR